MNESRIIHLRRELGWTQEKLAAESTVGLRTIQRLEAGDDASLETLALVAGALRVTVRELFAELDNAALSTRVESLEARALAQQMKRGKITSSWLWIFVGLGVAVSLASFAIGGQLGGTLFLSYWAAGTFIFVAIRRLILDPRLDTQLPLSHSKAELRRRQRATRSI